MISFIKLFISGLPLDKIKNFALIALVIFGLLMSLLWQLEKTRHSLTTSEFDAFKRELHTLAMQKEAENKLEIQQREKITENVVKSYAESINKLKAYYANNPHVKYRTISLHDNTCSGGVPSESESTTRASEATNGNAETTSTRDSREIQINAEILSKEIVQCLELIKFNVGQDDIR